VDILQYMAKKNWYACGMKVASQLPWNREGKLDYPGELNCNHEVDRGQTVGKRAMIGEETDHLCYHWR
jgi:hypothetical protein